MLNPGNDQVSKISVSTFAVGHCVKPFLPEGIKMTINVVFMLFLKSSLDLLRVAFPSDKLTKIPLPRSTNFPLIPTCVGQSYVKGAFRYAAGVMVENLNNISLEHWPLLAIYSNLIRLDLWGMFQNVNLLNQNPHTPEDTQDTHFAPLSLLAML